MKHISYRHSIEYLSPVVLKPYARNARVHSPKQIAQIAASIETFGFTRPILINYENMVLVGHGALAAAKSLGMDVVPCIKLKHLTKAQARAYILADNQLSLASTWDAKLLREELGELQQLDDFDLETTGFTDDDLIALDAELNPPQPPERERKDRDREPADPGGTGDGGEAAAPPPVRDGWQPLKFMIPPEQRIMVTEALKAMKARDGLDSDDEAICAICGEWMESREQD